jgi:flagellar biosynthesis/type III secretory pathway chaperone
VFFRPGAAVQTEQHRSATLKQQEEQLATELSERELSLNELNNRVQEINAENGRAIADNDAARRQYHDLVGQVHETNEQLTQAQQGAANSTEERRERIASLKAQLKAQLDLLFRRPQ